MLVDFSDEAYLKVGEYWEMYKNYQAAPFL